MLDSERACFCEVLGCTVLDSALRTDGRTDGRAQRAENGPGGPKVSYPRAENGKSLEPYFKTPQKITPPLRPYETLISRQNLVFYQVFGRPAGGGSWGEG